MVRCQRSKRHQKYVDILELGPNLTEITQTHTNTNTHALSPHRWQKSFIPVGLKFQSLKNKSVLPPQCAGCGFALVILVSLLSLCWIYICLVTFNDYDEVNW